MSMIVITIETRNSVFEGDGWGVESARILRECANFIEQWGSVTQLENRPLRDFNGNKVGLLTVDLSEHYRED